MVAVRKHLPRGPFPKWGYWIVGLLDFWMYERHTAAVVSFIESKEPLIHHSVTPLPHFSAARVAQREPSAL
jgi:hypothetical protein